MASSTSSPLRSVVSPVNRSAASPLLHRPHHRPARWRHDCDRYDRHQRCYRRSARFYDPAGRYFHHAEFCLLPFHPPASCAPSSVHCRSLVVGISIHHAGRTKFQRLLFRSRHPLLSPASLTSGWHYFRLPRGRNNLVMVINHRIDGPLAFFQTNRSFRRVFNHAFRVLIG